KGTGRPLRRRQGWTALQRHARLKRQDDHRFVCQTRREHGLPGVHGRNCSFHEDDQDRRTENQRKPIGDIRERAEETGPASRGALDSMIDLINDRRGTASTVCAACLFNTEVAVSGSAPAVTTVVKTVIRTT